MNDLLIRLTDTFVRIYQEAPAFIVRAPGRVNLLGEHVDYNAGWVLPIAIDRAAYVAARAVESAHVTIHAPDVKDQVVFPLHQLEEKRDVRRQPLKNWAKYAAGVAWALQQRGLNTAPLDAVIASDVPRGAGLSSSAAVEVAYAVTWQKIGGWSLPPLELALTCQKAENAYVGVNSGIMDQFASVCGRAGHALLLDCRSLEWQAVPMPPDIAVVVADTLVRRELGSSEYNVRRAQCEAAVKALSGPLPGIQALRDVSLADFNAHAHTLPEVVAKRARYVVEECDRMRRAPALLRAGDAAGFGALMNECHVGLRDLYEVSCKELDVMVTIAQSLPGCYGARLTGAGFGGCTVNLVAAAAAEDFKRELAARYARATGKTPEIYVCQAADGARVL